MIPTSAIARLYPALPVEAKVLTRADYYGPMSKQGDEFSGVALGLEDENALLRASLAEAHERLQQMERSAEGDTLTGLPGRARFIRELKRVVDHAERHGTPAAIVSIDLKGLDAINLNHGRIAGDMALIHVARTVSGLIRSTDLLARTAGGEFGLILDHLDQNSAIETAERLGRCIAASPVELGGGSVTVEAAIAVTGILSGDSFDEVVGRADRNLARAKSGC